MLMPPHPHLTYFATNDGAPALATVQSGTAVTAGGSAHTFGAWIQIHAGLAHASNFVMFRINGVETSADIISATTLNAYFDIGIGPDNANVTVIVEKLCGAQANGMGHMYFMPLRIPPNTPIWARHQNTAASAKGAVAITVWGGNMNPGTLPHMGRVMALGATPATTVGTTVTPTTSPTEDAWTQIVASTTEEYSGLMVSPLFRVDTSTTAKISAIDLAVGGAGAELVVGENLTTEYIFGTGEAHSAVCLFSLVGVPIGSRISARVAGNVAADTACSLIVYGFLH